MSKQVVLYLLCILLGLSMAACGTFVGRPQQDPVAGDGGATETEVPATASSSPTPTTTETAAVIVAPTETAPVEAVVTDTMVTATSPISGGDAVHAQKTAETLILPGCYDFDNGTSVVPPDTACDFNILPGPDDGTIEVYPVQTAQLAYGGVFPEAPTLAQCAASNAFSSDCATLAPMAAMYVCYRTGERRIGYLHFTAADLKQAGSLTFDWTTFATAVEANKGSAADQEALSYYNDTFGFWLTLPPTWNGFQTTEHTSAENHLPDVGSVCFTFAGHAPFCILKIDVWSSAEWSKLEMVPDGYYLGDNGQFVFAAGPYQPECVQLDSFQCERRQEVPSILAGFSCDAE